MTSPQPSSDASAVPSSGSAVALPPGGPCGLIADVAAAVGRAPIASPNPRAVGATQRCLWVVARDPSRFVGLNVGPAANHAATIDALGDGEAVEGLGDDARWWAAARTLSVAIGDRSIQLDLQLDDAEATRDVAEALARQALEGLGAGRRTAARAPAGSPPGSTRPPWPRAPRTAPRRWSRMSGSRAARGPGPSTKTTCSGQRSAAIA